jgi:hypothetical protein
VNHLFLVSVATLLSIATFAAPTPKYGAQATRLVDQHVYLEKNPAPDYWALSGFYVPQQTGSACSIASVTMTVNAARSSQKLLASDAVVTQTALLARVKDPKWTQAVGNHGHGVTLDSLAPLVKKSFEAYEHKNVTVKTIHADGSKNTKDEIIALLKKNEGNSKDFILANFLQSEFTGDPEGRVGHIAPVAAFDESNQRVLIFDPDRDYYEPYWVSVDTFMRGVETRDETAKQSRGIVYVSFKE